MKGPKPIFNQKMPSNWKTSLSLNSADEFKNKYPGRYRVLLFFGLTAIFLPMAIYLFLAIAIFKMDSMLIVLGLFGSIIFGAAFFNIAGAFIHQYMGHKFTIICFTVGLIVCALSIILA